MLQFIKYKAPSVKLSDGFWPEIAVYHCLKFDFQILIKFLKTLENSGEEVKMNFFYSSHFLNFSYKFLHNHFKNGKMAFLRIF